MKLVSKVAFLFFSCFLLNSFLVQGRHAYHGEDVVTYKEEECNDQMDLHIVVDSSGSIGNYNWVFKVSPLIEKLIEYLNISENTINITLQLFASRVSEFIGIDSKASKNKEAALEMVKHLKSKFMKGTTYLHLPLTYIVHNYILAGKTRKNVQQMILLLTDGVPNYPVRAKEAADEARKLNVPLAILGIGSQIDSYYNRSLVGCSPKKKNCKLYAEASWKDLEKIISPFIKTVCHEVEKLAACGPWKWSECSVTCGKGVMIGQREPLHDKCKRFIEVECELPACYPTDPERVTILPTPNPILPPNDRRRRRSTSPDNNPTRNDETKKINTADDHPSTINGDNPSTVPSTNPETNPETNPDSIPNSIPSSIPSSTPENTPVANESDSENKNTDEISKEDAAQSDLIEDVVSEEIKKNTDETSKEDAAQSDLIEDVVSKEIKKNSLESSDENKVEESEAVSPAVIPINSDNANENENEGEQSGQSNNQEQKKKGTSSANGYKIAGGVLGGAALLGTAFAGYKFVSGSTASALQSDGVPFDDVPAEGEKDFDEQEQFKLPDESEWN